MNKGFFVLVFILFVSCKYDNFYYTERILQSDKKEYCIGDDLNLDFEIKSVEEKNIRFYRNFKNLSISFSLIDRPNHIQNENWSKWSSELLRDTTIVNYKISKNNSFHKYFKGRIEEINDSIIIVIPELRFKASFNKKNFYDSTYVRIHGICLPIDSEPGASIEEYFNAKDIRILK